MPDRLDVTTAGDGVYAVRSASSTVYLLRCGQAPMMMRLTGASTHSRGWWDNQWVPAVAVGTMDPATGQTEHGAIEVGKRAKWIADPGGQDDANHYWWISRVVTCIEPLTQPQLEALLAERGVVD